MSINLKKNEFASNLLQVVCEAEDTVALFPSSSILDGSWRTAKKYETYPDVVDLSKPAMFNNK